jgi:two-component system chemotaxis response regulator CheY
MQLRILIVDDTPFIAEIISHVALQHGHTIVGQASNGQQAIQLTSQLKPDLIFMDIIMPIMNGIQAAELISKQTPQSKIVMMSTVDHEDLMKESLNAGSVSYIRKPFTKNDLLQVFQFITQLHSTKKGAPRV